MENLPLWCGIGSLVVCLIAIIIIFLTRKNIADIIDRDIILFKENFEIKKTAITNALDIVDEVSLKGRSIINDFGYIQKAKQCYNDLICVVSDIKVAEEFYELALNVSHDATSLEIATFKYMCRKDIGFKTKKPKEKDLPLQTNPTFYNNETPRPIQRPIAPQPRPVQRPVAPQVNRVEKPKK